METMKKISFIALACTLVYTGCLVESKADIDSQVKNLELTSELKTQLDTLDGRLISPSNQDTRCNIVTDVYNSGVDDRFFLGNIPGSTISSNYNFRLNLSDSILDSEKNTTIFSSLDSTNFKLELFVDSSFSDIPKSLLFEYKRVNSTVFGSDTFSIDSLDNNTLNFFRAPKTWSDSLSAVSSFENSFTITPILDTSLVQGSGDVATKPTEFHVNLPAQLLQELQSKKTETHIYDFRITNLDENASQWIFSRNSQYHQPSLKIGAINRELLHQGECITNKDAKPFLTSLKNDTLNLKFELDSEPTKNHLIRRAWLLLDSTTYTAGVEDSIVKSANFYNTTRIYTADTLEFQESALDTLSQTRVDLIANKNNLSLPVTSVIDHSVADTSSVIEKQILFGLSTSSIDTKYFYNNLAWFQLNSESVPVKIVVERLIEEIE
jgi:hypothetical protein